MYILILSRNLTPSSLAVGSSSGISTWVGPATLLAPSDVLVLKYIYIYTQMLVNPSSGVLVSVHASCVVDRWFKSQSGQSKDYKIGICCFSAKHIALRRKIKDWLAWNQNNVSEWSDMSTLRLLFEWAITIKIQLSVFV